MVRRRRRGLSEEDLSLWREVTRTAKPLGPRTGALQPKPSASKPSASKDNGPAASPDNASGAADAQAPVAPFRIGAQAPQRGRGHDLSPTIERQLAAHPVRMDAKTFGKLKRGKLRPERKLDLHGMTLAEAHPRLRRFVRDAHDDGLRLVIVVTGKGRSGDDAGGPIPSPRGILRQQVPVWLHMPDLRPFVLQVTDAHLRHGGAGAYYVYLTRGLTRGPAGGGRRG
jgi:DNA-nicking Smr family endonuclease